LCLRAFPEELTQKLLNLSYLTFFIMFLDIDPPDRVAV
jgi:hypothetical protein